LSVVLYIIELRVPPLSRAPKDPNCVQQESTGRKIRSVVYWQGALKQWRKTNGCKIRPWGILIPVCDK